MIRTTCLNRNKDYRLTLIFPLKQFTLVAECEHKNSVFYFPKDLLWITDWIADNSFLIYV
ncbi:hypothetical protein DIT68_01015 [Brumimicrobium oceani]|uniref:Uncharacterized protein n=1 Tax=Brumimicrobium oceani TaxID=2100725 RepID=A0A2U2XGK3_9FLAO|nr:hypothetical protein DIT68_01015 [Brumimicrobium oceani]